MATEMFVIFDKSREMWWCDNECGYTAELLCAGLYTQEKIDQLSRERRLDQDTPYPLHVALEAMRRRSPNGLASMVVESLFDVARGNSPTAAP